MIGHRVVTYVAKKELAYTESWIQERKEGARKCGLTFAEHEVECHENEVIRHEVVLQRADHEFHGVRRSRGRPTRIKVHKLTALDAK